MPEAPRLTVQSPVTEADTETWIALAITARVCDDILSRLVDPLPNSLLRDDDANYQWEKQSVWLHCYLRAAVDHLMVWANIVNPLQVHSETEVLITPRAYLTLARGTIEASAQAGWVLLGTDTTERTLRHLRLMYHDLRYQEEAHRNHDVAVAEHARRRRSEIKERVQDVYSLGSIKHSEPTYTSMIKEVAAAAGWDPDDAILTWRAASAAAHGKSWYSDYGTTAVVGDEYEPGHYRVTRTPEAGHITDAIGLAVRLLDFGTATFARHLGANAEVLRTTALITVVESMPTAPGEEASKSAFLAHHAKQLVELTAIDNPQEGNSDG